MCPLPAKLTYLGDRMSQFHVSQIETQLRQEYEQEFWKHDLDTPNNLSRLLGRRAVDLVVGANETGNVTIEITDGADDRGIDAIGVDTATNTVVLVQSKWRHDGTGSMSLADVLKFLDGVRSLLGMQAAQEPVHASTETRELIHEVLKTPGAKVRMVTATPASEPLAPAVSAPIEELLGQLNDLEGIEPLATHLHLGQVEFFNALAQEPAAAVNLDVQIQDWGKTNDPIKLFYGRVSAAEIAGWHAEYGSDLFAENIRVVIPRSDINEGILKTVTESAEYLGYYNNGITILARSIEIGPGGLLNRDVGYFKLTGASIVNGAQTVSTLGRVLGSTAEENLGNGFVLVRCIEVPEDNDDVGRKITRFANTQNEVSGQDFTFLDDEQHRLRRELSVIGYEYLIRSAEQPRSTDPSKVIDVRQAAISLACASSIAHAVQAKREISRLFTDTSTYSALFNPNTDVLLMARAVEVVRSVDAALDDIEKASEGARSGVAVHGRRIVAYCILNDIGSAHLRDPEIDFDAQLASLQGNAAAIVDQIVEVFPDASYPGNVFKNQARCSQLLSDAGLG